MRYESQPKRHHGEAYVPRDARTQLRNVLLFRMGHSSPPVPRQFPAQFPAVICEKTSTAYIKGVIVPKHVFFAYCLSRRFPRKSQRGTVAGTVRGTGGELAGNCAPSEKETRLYIACAHPLEHGHDGACAQKSFSFWRRCWALCARIRLRTVVPVINFEFTPDRIAEDTEKTP